MQLEFGPHPWMVVLEVAVVPNGQSEIGLAREGSVLSGLRGVKVPNLFELVFTAFLFLEKAEHQGGFADV